MFRGHEFVENFTMKITAQEEYGMRCVLRVARAESGSATLPKVAAAEGLSVPYVAKLMAVLRHAGILESVRGRAGGYRLARPAEQIGLGSLLLTLGEPLFEEHDYCQKHAGTEAPNGVCTNKATCTLKSVWQTLELWMRRTLDQITLADLIQHEGRLPELLRERLAAAVFEDEPQMLSLNVVMK
jgi:Rrf2 family protein